MSILASLETRYRPLVIVVGLVLIGVIGAIDISTGYEFALSVFYVLPISLLTWFRGRPLGLAASVISAVVWFAADVGSGHPYSHPLIPIWNTLIRFSFFVIITMLLSALRRGLRREAELARRDYLTGAVNSRYFRDLMQMEIERMRRYKHAFTVAYIDLDNFKSVNDQFGHATGDRVLCDVVSCIAGHIRKSDVVARLGGDEFLLLLPETNQAAARPALSKIQTSLLEAMRSNQWPVTFSIGVLTFTAAPPTIDELVRMADDLMYSVKHESKDAIKFATYPG